jgi:FkbM family methyltransferase
MRADHKERLFRYRHYARLGLKLARLGAGPRSRVKLAILGLVIVAKTHSRWRDSLVHVRLQTGADRVMTVAVATRTDLDVLREVVLDRDYELPASVRPAVIVDLGAHIGIASVYFASLWPDARLVAVEADPRLIPTLRHNLAGRDASITHAAVGARRGSRLLHIAPQTWENSLDQVGSGDSAVEVPGMTLTDVLEMAEQDGHLLLKVDIEGAEWEFIGEGLPDRVGTIVGEIHRRAGRDPGDLLASVAESHDVTILRDAADCVVFRGERRCERA